MKILFIYISERFRDLRYFVHIYQLNISIIYFVCLSFHEYLVRCYLWMLSSLLNDKYLVTGLTILAPPAAPTPPCLGEDKLLLGLDFAFAGEPIPLLPKLPRLGWLPVLPPGELVPFLRGELVGELEAVFGGELLGLLILREY